MTTPEKKMAEALDKAGIEYSFQVPLVNGFILDFVINGTNLAVEVDGEFWHNGRERYDKMRDEINAKVYIYRKGYRTLRFPASVVCDYPELCIKKIWEAIQLRYVLMR